MVTQVEEAPTAGAGTAHQCLAYEGKGGFDEAAAEYLAAGEARGERTVLIRRDVAWAQYGRDGNFDPCEPLAAYEHAVRDARADGYEGVCVVADVSLFVATQSQRRTFARYEHLVDRFIRRGGGLAGLCAFDATVVGEDGLAHLDALHPHHPPGHAPFHIHAADHPVDLVASGELDLAGRATLVEVLDALAPDASTDELAIDAAAVHFVDHRSLVMIEEFAEHHGLTVLLRHTTDLVRRMIDLLDLRRVRAEVRA